MAFELPERLNIAEWLLDARVREGRGDRPALLTDHGTRTYRDVQVLANRFGHLLRSAGVEPEQRVIIALPDGPEFVAALTPGEHAFEVLAIEQSGNQTLTEGSFVN